MAGPYARFALRTELLSDDLAAQGQALWADGRARGGPVRRHLLHEGDPFYLTAALAAEVARHPGFLLETLLIGPYGTGGPPEVITSLAR